MPPDFQRAPLKLDQDGENAFKIPRKRHFKLRILYPTMMDKFKTAEVNIEITRLVGQKTLGESLEPDRVFHKQRNHGAHCPLPNSIDYTC